MEGGTQKDEVPLEVRMRNLILKNAESSHNDRISPGTLASSGSAPAEDGSLSSPSKQPHKSGRKRLNQAQRRQMSSQLMIPIDPRSAQPQSSQHYGNGPGPNYRPQYQSREHRAQSPAFQPSPINDGFTRASPQLSHSRHYPSPSYPGISPQQPLFDWRQPSGMQTGLAGGHQGPARPNHMGRHSMGQARSLYHAQSYSSRPEDLDAQVALLEKLSVEILANAEIDVAQIGEKENFRLLIEDACRVAITQYEQTVNRRSDFPPLSVQLRCFGSLSSGFATKSSDMDLGLLSPFSHPQPEAPGSPIPRIIEKIFLGMGLGARLLSKTRVPIIKVCQKPPEKLYSDLLEERMKWERGDEDPELDEEDVAKDHTTITAGKDLSLIKSATTDGQAHVNDNHAAEKMPPIEADEQQHDGYQSLLDEIKQGAKSLSNYQVAVKKVLRTLGGRDITNSTAANFSAHDYQILNDVCKAFIGGLANQKLKTRLQSYTSLSFDSYAPLPPNRSIFGVFAQVEGEKMVMAWESRRIFEKDEHSERQAKNRVEQWRDLQNKPTFGLDPLSYNKELLLANDALKKVPSIALSLLQQDQYESASSYHNRAIKLMIDLGGHDSPSSASPVLPAILQQYVHGIHDPEIRSQVSQFLLSLPSPSLRATARRHKSLQLARDFERSLDKNLYSAGNVEDIQRYIELLRSPLVPSMDQDAHFDFVLPMTAESWSLVAKLRDIQDPSRMSPNQPRDPYRDRLEFPKSGIGVQCDINFSAQLALQNTHLLRCYSLTDPRVRPLVLFVKHWAKIRGINTPYRGTLSSYGYVLMMLHYLVNVARPPVCPNLQLAAPPLDSSLTPEQISDTVQCKGRNIRFWRDERQIVDMARQGRLTQNTDSVGLLLRGFFQYYAQNNMMNADHMRGFDWGRDVLSLRTLDGILSKQEKGWTGAKTVVVEVRSAELPPPSEPDMRQANPATPSEGQWSDQPGTVPKPMESPDATATTSKIPQDRSKSEVKEVRHRYLFAIEDPFELDHNVARTVTHNGIVSIRDEFRRAWRIIRNAGKTVQAEDLLQDITTEKKGGFSSFMELLDEIHGKPPV